MYFYETIRAQRQVENLRLEILTEDFFSVPDVIETNEQLDAFFDCLPRGVQYGYIMLTFERMTALLESLSDLLVYCIGYFRKYAPTTILTLAVGYTIVIKITGGKIDVEIGDLYNRTLNGRITQTMLVYLGQAMQGGDWACLTLYGCSLDPHDTQLQLIEECQPIETKVIAIHVKASKIDMEVLVKLMVWFFPLVDCLNITQMEEWDGIEEILTDYRNTDKPVLYVPGQLRCFEVYIGVPQWTQLTRRILEWLMPQLRCIGFASYVRYTTSGFNPYKAAIFFGRLQHLVQKRTSVLFVDVSVFDLNVKWTGMLMRLIIISNMYRHLRLFYHLEHPPYILAVNQVNAWFASLTQHENSGAHLIRRGKVPRRLSQLSMAGDPFTRVNRLLRQNQKMPYSSLAIENEDEYPIRMKERARFFGVSLDHWKPNYDQTAREPELVLDATHLI